ncbi:rod shape-determining protein MreC [Pyruvatibacter sp.]|uniref:rod shape-determining protein MreC n=1 Tax=Pyruvatibacter sp. TaxID=1981328 RepID=UPI0032EFE741
MREPTNRVKLPFRVSSHRLSLVLALTFASVLLVGRAESYLVDQTRQVITDLSAPLLEVTSRPVAAVRNFIASTDEYAYVFEENARLRAENEELKVWREQARALERRVARFEALLDVAVEPSIEYATGNIIGDSGGPFVHAFIVNVPAADGVEPGQAVVDDEGLIGRVVSTGATASRVLLLTDLNSRVPVRVEPSGYRAIAVGDNSRFPRIDFLPPEAALSPGDRIVTSGHGGLMPPGLPVGIVVLASDGSPRLQTNSEFDRTSAVRVLKYEFPTRVVADTDEEAAAEDAARETIGEDVAPKLPGDEPAAADQLVERAGEPGAAAGTDAARAGPPAIGNAAVDSAPQGE